MIFKWFKNKGSSADAARDAAVPRHIGELWLAIQETAEREDSSWSDRNVISYYHEGAEAQKDILRWLANGSEGVYTSTIHDCRSGDNLSPKLTIGPRIM